MFTMKQLTYKGIEKDYHLYDVEGETGWWFWKKDKIIKIYTHDHISWYDYNSGINIVHLNTSFDNQVKGTYRTGVRDGNFIGK